MNLLKKILLVAIVALFARNVEGMNSPAQTFFDLPPKTPGLMRDKQQKKVCERNKDCVHVIIPGTNAERALTREQHDDLYEAMAVDGNIYFPADGSQPTTPEAVKYSCANIDNREDSPITDWYMKMFGVIPFRKAGAPSPNDYVKAGRDANVGNAERIIKFSDDFPIKQLFIQNFRKIASTSVGRVLLYRILMEIRRKNREKNCFGQDIKGNVIEYIDTRNKCLSVSIINTGTFSFLQDGHISVSDNKNNPLILKKIEGINLMLISPGGESEFDVSLYHEFCHWYHFLRYTQRFENERHAVSPVICKYYDELLNIGAENGRLLWCQTSSSQKNDLEEVRTILGCFPEEAIKFQVEGDDLSENLYRYIKHGEDNLRFGHISSVTISIEKSKIDIILEDIRRIGGRYL